MITTPRFLLLEDKPLDTEAIQTVLTNGGIDYELVRVDSRADFVTALETDSFDLILAAYAMPGFDGIVALEVARTLRPEIPFIFVSASLGEELAIETLKRGATDYVLKQRLERLVPSVQRALEAQERRERKRVEAALRESEAEYRMLLESIDEGFCVCQLLFDQNGEPADHRILKVNAAFEQLTGLEQATGKTAQELVPDLEADFLEVYANVVRTGEPIRFEQQSIALNRWFDLNVFCIGEPQNHQFAILFTNITDRKRAELNKEFLATVSQNLVETTHVDEIVQTVGAGLNRYLQVSTCAFVEINQQADEVIVKYEWHQGDRPSLIGVYPISEFVTSEIHQTAQAGQPIVIRNYATDPRVIDPSRYAALGIGAEINIPLIRDGEWKFSLIVFHQQPYDWRDDEIELMQELANRVWAKLERARAETALSESRAELERQVQKFDVTLSTITDYVFGFDRDGRFLYANQALLDLWGLTAEEAIGKTMPELDYPEAVIQPVMNNIRRVFETGESVKDEDAYTSRTGVEGYFEYVFNPVFAADGTVDYIIGSSRNIRDRKQAEATLQESEAQIRSILESITDGFFALDQDWQFTYVNPQAERILNRTPGDLLNKVIWEVYPGTVGMEFERAYRQTASERVASSFVSFYPDHNCWYEVYAYPAADGITVYFRNVTAQIQAEATLRESEEKYRTLFESIDQGFCLLEVLFDADEKPFDYRFIEVSEVFEQQSGLVNAVGKTILELVPNLEPQWTERYGQVAKSGEATRFEADVTSMNRIFNIYAFHSGAPGQNLVAVLFNDITERKRREANLAFLAEIQDDCARLTTADAIMQTIGAKIGSYLNLSVCAFVDIDEAQDQAIVPYNWHRADVPTLVGTHRISQFVSEECYRAARAGVVVVVNDTNTDARTNTENCAALNVQSFIHVPFLRDGQWKFLFNVYDSRPRGWREDEIELFSELANRILPRLERTRAEAALHESEERLRLFVTASSDMMYRMSADWSEMHYLTGKDFLASTRSPICTWFEQYIPQAVQSQVLAAIEEAIRTKSPFELEHRVIQLDGTVGWAFSRAIPLLDAENEIIEWFGAANNITDRKQSEAIIATDLENTRLLRDLSARLINEDNIQVLYDEIMATAIALTKADAGTVQILDKATQVLVLLASQGFNRTMTDHFYRVNASSNTSCGIALIRGSRTFANFDVPECDDPDGSLRMLVNAGYLSAQSTPLISRSGKVIGMVSTHWCKRHRPTDRELRFLDLLARQAADLIEQRQTETERKQILERERAAREEAERANRIKDEFLAVLSHELRSPLNPILGWARLLQNGKLDAARQAEALKTIERNAQLQTQLIEDLLDISRIMQGKLSLAVAPVSLTFVISAAVETVRLAAEAKNIGITLDLISEIAPISGDAARLQQVVWNLLTNAVKFTLNGGQVTVELRQLDQLAQIRVIDTGKGISPDFLPHVFEYFRQEDGSTTRKFGGLGLGLAIVRQIVEMHGGMVRAESQGEHQGATFIVQLPVMPQATSLVSEPTPTQVETETPLNNLQILLVDDDNDTREFQTFLLEQSGAKVTAVASGLEALQVLDQFTPDVIISDVGMAEMDGYMLMQQIRSRPSGQESLIPAIALTAYAAEYDQQQAIAAGFQKHISKPIEPETLVQAIIDLIEGLGEKTSVLKSNW